MDTRKLVLACALPGVPGESRKEAFNRAADNSGLSVQRIRAFFYGKGNPPDEAREKLAEAAQACLALWGDDATTRQRVDELKLNIKRTREHVAEVRRRATDRAPSAVDIGDAERQSSFAFWLGREAAERDREGGA